MVLERLLYPCVSGPSPDPHNRKEVMQGHILKVFERQGINPACFPAQFSCSARRPDVVRGQAGVG